MINDRSLTGVPWLPQKINIRIIHPRVTFPFNKINLMFRMHTI